MHRVRFRVVLPIIFASAAIVFFDWDYENSRVVASMGMGWDTGPPMWPYETIPLISYAVNVPAYIVALPILKLLGLRTTCLQYAVWFPLIVFLWWWVGVFIDFGLPIPRSASHPRLNAGLVLVGTVGLILLAAHVCLEEYHWFRNYWPGHPPIYAVLSLRAIGPTVWCIFFARAFVRAAIHIIRHETPPPIRYPIGYRTLLVCVALMCLNVVGIARLDRLLSPPRDPKACEFDRLYRLGCVHGIVTDEAEKPIRHIEVNLIPTSKTGSARRHGTKYEWTDEQGRYNFDGLEPGAYLLAVNSFEASAGPDEEFPFATLYYRSADDESGADAVSVEASAATNLTPFRLRRLAVVTIPVKVVWENGLPAERSDIVVRNIRYFGLLHGTQIDNGAGMITLPKGYLYEVNASVQCDAGAIIDQRESKPYQQFTVADDSTPTQLTFVLPGTPCALWKPD